MKLILVGLIFMTSTLYGRALPGDAQVESISDFSGGLNTREPSFKLNNTFSPFMRNVFIDNGRIERSPGFTVLGSSHTLEKVTGIFPYSKEDGEKTFLVTDSSLTLETSDFNLWTFVSSVSNPNALLCWFQVRDKMWGFNGVDSVLTWDGTTLTSLDGGGTTPNVPKFRFIDYWHERVWGLNDPTGKSNLNFSALTSTDGIILDPDDNRAWPGTNILKVGQGDGQLGTALWIRRGQLSVGKERSIYTIFGTGESSYFAREEVSLDDGVASDESVVNLDGISYWLGQDGIYAEGQRISDDIETEVNLIRKPVSNTVQNTWDTQEDFSQGEFYGTTATPSGFIVINEDNFLMNHASETVPTITTQDDFIQFDSTSALQFTDFAVRLSTEDIPANFYGYVESVHLFAQAAGPSVGTLEIDLRIRNLNSREEMVLRKNIGKLSNFTEIIWSRSQGENPVLNPDPVFFTADELLNSSFTIQVTTAIDLSATEFFQFFSATTTGFSEITLVPSTTVQFVSDVATNVTVDAWGKFEALDALNTGTIDYFIKTGTNVFHVTNSTRVWNPINSGAIVSAPIGEKYTQWAATLNSVFTTAVEGTNIDQVTIDHIEGAGSFNRAFGLDWKNRYWLFTSTDGSDDMSFGLVKAKSTNNNPIAWMPIEGINIRSVAKRDDVFYAGSSTAGVVFRLDNGTSYNGTAIHSIYDTPDLILGNNYFSKNILKYLYDYQNDTDLNLTVKTSLDFGDFTEKTISVTGTGRTLFVLKGVTDRAKTLRLRTENVQLDRIFEVNDISVLYVPTQVLE